MKSLPVWIACACIAGCASSTEDVPVGTGGGNLPLEANTKVVTGPGGSTEVNVEGRVCLLSDPRNVRLCSSDLAGGINVQLGLVSTITQPNGQFVLTAPLGSHLSFVISSPTIVTATMPFSPQNTIPVLPLSLFKEVLASSGVTPPAGTGSILATVVDRTGAPVAGVTATSAPASAFAPISGQAGSLLIPGVAAGSATLTLRAPGSTAESTVAGVQVIDGGLTIEEAVLP